jgi:hypothetical protein
MLTFAVYHLMKNPDALAKLRAEIDEVLGDQPIQLSDISKMPYTIGESEYPNFYFFGSTSAPQPSCEKPSDSILPPRCVLLVL